MNISPPEAPQAHGCEALRAAVGYPTRRGELPLHLTIILLALLTLTPTTRAAAPDTIDMLPLEDALTAGMTEHKVTVLVFGAEWCGWCRKMESTTLTDPQVIELAGRFVWAEVDIDERPDIAAMLGVTGVPAVAFVNARGQVLTLRPGYHPPTAMATLLREYADKADAPSDLQQALGDLVRAEQTILQAEPGPATDAAVRDLLTRLADADAMGRHRAVRTLQQAGARAWPALVEALAADQLALRAAAHDLLVQFTQQSFPYDPFAEQPERQAMADTWRQWLQTQTSPTSEPAPES